METVSFYDALDRRIGFDDSGTQTWTVYDGSSADAEPYADFNGSGTPLVRYLVGPGVVNGAVVDELLARTSSGGTTAWYLPDKLGSVRDIVGSSGTELDHVVYDSFGNIVTETNASNGDRFKYAGMEYDSVIGQYYDRARYFEANIGRFMSKDPESFHAGGINLYEYVSNDTANSTDTSGMEPDLPQPNNDEWWAYVNYLWFDARYLRDVERYADREVRNMRDFQDLTDKQREYYENALRHAAGMALTYLYYGNQKSYEIGNIHENYNYSYEDSGVDQYNNQAARKLAEKLKQDPGYNQMDWITVQARLHQMIMDELDKSYKGGQGAFIVDPSSDPRTAAAAAEEARRYKAWQQTQAQLRADWETRMKCMYPINF